MEENRLEENRLEIEDCLRRLLEEIHPMADNRTREVSIADCPGMVLAREVRAQMMVPPFPKSAMDGYAVRAADIQGASGEQPVRLNVTGELLAGDYAEIPARPGTAVRVMTGSFVPEGFDAVVPQEKTDYGQETVEIYVSLPAFSNYCKVGEDIREGERIISRDTRLTPAHVGILASLGIERVSVYEPAAIAILSTGSELTEVGMALSAGKIYNSIAWQLSAAIQREGLRVSGRYTCPDEEGQLSACLEEALKTADFVITTGGVSVGKKDIVPKVLQDMGARELFRGANIQPGTPTLACVRDGKVILSLSGNPYAAIANFELYFWPAMAKMMRSASFDTKRGTAVLCSEYPKGNRLRRLLRAYAADGRVTLPSPVHASSVIHNLTECNCFIDLEAGRSVKAGEEVRIRYFKGEG